MDKQHLRILIVDDDALVRELLTEILQSEDYPVETAKNGIEALTKYKSGAGFDLILSDMNMPEMNGLEFIKKVRDTGSDIPIVVLTVNDDISTAIEAMKCGANDYILKDENIQDTLDLSVGKIWEKHQLKLQNMQLLADLASKSEKLEELNKIGIALSAEHDPDALQNMILTQARKITSADAGSLYLIEKNPDVAPDEKNFWVDKLLRFKLAQNDTLQASYTEFVMPIERKSIAGYTILTGEPLNIENAYNIGEESHFQHNRSFDEKMNYMTKSVLCIPMCSHQGEMIGVLQLINRKINWDVKLSSRELFDTEVIPFDKQCVDLACSLAGQASVSIENMRLYEEIRRLFEGFILASGHAIEQRDPTTSGHSERVSILTLGLAQQVDRIDHGPYGNIKFSREDFQQIKYASLLHDFGKIGVRENVLVKEKKLYPYQHGAVLSRFKLLKKTLEAQTLQIKIDYLMTRPKEEALQLMASLDKELAFQFQKIEEYFQFVMQANEPRVLAEGGFEKLKEISQLTFLDSGSEENLLTDEEVKLLSIPRGTLSDTERLEIESHVNHTYNFLSRIPWPSHLKGVPQIASSHHEKLDGKGYPNKLHSDQIPIQAKMMAISDVFDALTASDRPYKKSLPTEKALSIIEMEVKDGKADGELFQIFLEAEVYKAVIKNQ